MQESLDRLSNVPFHCTVLVWDTLEALQGGGQTLELESTRWWVFTPFYSPRGWGIPSTAVSQLSARVVCWIRFLRGMILAISSQVLFKDAHLKHQLPYQWLEVACPGARCGHAPAGYIDHARLWGGGLVHQAL